MSLTATMRWFGGIPKEEKLNLTRETSSIRNSDVLVFSIYEVDL